MAYLGNININNKSYPVGSTLYGTCFTPASTQIKESVDVNGFDKLTIGVTVSIKMGFSNTAEAPELKINNTMAKPIYPSTSTSWSSGQVVSFTYDGTYWQINSANDVFEEIASTDVNACFVDT